MDVPRLKRRIQRARPGEEEVLLDELVDGLAGLRADPPDPATEYRVLWLLLPLARRLGQLARFRGEIDRAVHLAGDRREERLALASLRADLEEQEGDLRKAEETLRASLADAEGLDEAHQGVLLLKLARVLSRRDRGDQARSLLEDVLPILEGKGHASLAARCRFQLGNLALHEGRLEEAIVEHQRALAARRELGEVRGVCASTSALGAVSLAAGNYPQALHWYRASEAEAQLADEEVELGWALLGLGRTLGRLGDFAGAAGKLRTAVGIRRRGADEEGRAAARLALAEAELQLGRTQQAFEGAQEALFHLSLIGRPSARGDAEQLLGRVHLVRRREREARQRFEAALALHADDGDEAAVAFDRSWLLKLALAWPLAEEIEPLLDAIAGYLGSGRYPELGERLDLGVWQALEALARLGVEGDRVRTRDRFLARAYRTLMRKASYLEAAERHAFLFRVPDNDAIVRAATAAGLTEEKIASG